MKNQIKNILIIVAIIAIIFLFFLLITYFGGESAMDEPPKVVCKKDKSGKEECFLTAHVHSSLAVFENNKEVVIGYERGNLERNHTHAQKGINHWHSLIKINPEEKNKTFTYQDLSVFDDFKLEFIPHDFALEIITSPKFVVNNKEVNSSHHWQAGDKIEIYYE